jgi:hypothetical protein
MENIDGTVSMSASELADLIQAYEDKINETTEDDLREHFKAKMKGLLFDVRKELIYALRLIDVEKSA